MTEAELKVILARNPQIKATGYDHQTVRPICSSQPESGTPDALVPVVSRKRESQASVIVRFVVCRSRLLDVDAVAGCCKDLLDGLQNAEIIPGDKPGEIHFEASQKKVGRKDEGVIIEIEYAYEYRRTAVGFTNQYQ